VCASASASKLSAAFPTATLSNAFPSALDGVTHKARIASPLIVGAQDVENDILKPAIDGTTAILKSALKCKTLKNIVVTSLFAAVINAMKGWRKGYVYEPADWNPISYVEVADPGLDLSSWPEAWRGFITYMVLKIEGEGDLSFSSGLLWKTAALGEMVVLGFPNWVDVRGVARVHILALQYSRG